MINIIGFSDESFESQFLPIVYEAYQKAAKLLTNISPTVNVKFVDNGGSDITGVGGFSVSENQINLRVVRNYPNLAAQRKNLYSAVLHEFFHLQQGFTYQHSPFTALESAIYEGCAVIFERDYAHNQAAYGEYTQFSDQQLLSWLREIESVGVEYFEKVDTWHKWAFYHPEYDQKWIIYKVGTWLMDKVLHENNLDILDVKDMTASEIIQLRIS